MNDAAARVVRSIRDEQLHPFAMQLAAYVARKAGNVALSESRAKALLLASNALDTPTLNDFGRITASPTQTRLALFDLLDQSGLADDNGMGAILPATAEDVVVNWLSLIVGAFALKADYPLDNLDPAAPPAPFSPAGQVISQSATLVRQQVQRSATDRGKLAKKVAFSADMAPALDQLDADGNPIAAAPPHFRTPIPVRYPEYSRDTISVDKDDAVEPSNPVVRGEPIRITEDDLASEQRDITVVVGESRPVPRSSSGSGRSEGSGRSGRSLSDVQVPDAVTNAARSATQAAGEMASAVRKRVANEPMELTKLRVLVQRHPNGPGIPGVQVKVQTKGVKKFVAATTNENGVFLCSLPVRARAGMTYYVDVVWPAELGGKRERKTITLNADREQFTLPFYHTVLI